MKSNNEITELINSRQNQKEKVKKGSPYNK